MKIFVFASQLKERNCCRHSLKSSDLELRPVLYVVSVEGDVKHSNEEKGEAGADQFHLHKQW